MKRNVLLALLTCSVFLSSPAAGTEPGKTRPMVHEELVDTWDDLTRGLRDWFDRTREHFSGKAPREERPLISIMLRNRDKLGLSTEQVRNLEQLRKDYERESIRRDADLRVAEMDLTSLTEASAVDMGKVEAKVREIERLRAEQRLARIRSIEKGKQQLTAEQRKKLQELLTESQLTRLERGRFH